MLDATITSDAATTVDVGETVTVSANSTPNLSDQVDTSTYEWDLDDDGTYELTQSWAEVSWATEGTFNVNKKDLTEYFSEIRDHKDIMKVLDNTNTKGSIDVFVKTNGGGYTGQAGAIILGLGRALAKFDPSLDGVLRDNGYLSRDPRRVERKKPGQPGARKRFQFSKR